MARIGDSTTALTFPCERDGLKSPSPVQYGRGVGVRVVEASGEGSLHGAAAGEELDDEHHKGNDQKQVNQAPEIRDGETEQPDDENDCQ
jgi:hypothetical protein